MDRFIFVRDRNDREEYGFNLYHLTSSSGPVKQLTDFIGGGFSPKYVDGSLIMLVSMRVKTYLSNVFLHLLFRQGFAGQAEGHHLSQRLAAHDVLTSFIWANKTVPV